MCVSTEEADITADVCLRGGDTFFFYFSLGFGGGIEAETTVTERKRQKESEENLGSSCF